MTQELSDVLCRSTSKVNQDSATFGCLRHWDTGDNMVLVCHVILVDHMIRGSRYVMSGEPLMISKHHVTFGGHRRSGSGDTMFLMVEEQDSKCFHLNLRELFISKAH